MSADAILAMSTSSISIAPICQWYGTVIAPAEALFQSVPLMKRVESIPGPFTAPAVVQAMRQLSGRNVKTSLLAKEDPGFLVNFGGRA
jgi:3-hydroxybutyryl-CoA dehydrogenase